MKKVGIIGIFLLISTMTTQAKEIKSIKDYEKELSHCVDTFVLAEQKCSEKGSMECYDFLMSLHKKTQQCLKHTGTQILKQFYALSEQEAEDKLNKFSQFMYDNYLFLYNDTSYCQQNNCGVSPYLNSEYTTTKELDDYIHQMINSISARD